MNDVRTVASQSKEQATAIGRLLALKGLINQDTGAIDPNSELARSNKGLVRALQASPGMILLMQRGGAPSARPVPPATPPPTPPPGPTPIP